MKYVKVMFGNKGAYFEYKIGEVNVATIWNPEAEKGRDFGGFNYAAEDCILRWLHRGDTIYDVEIPEDAENIKVEGATTIYRTNKILLKNPFGYQNKVLPLREQLILLVLIEKFCPAPLLTNSEFTITDTLVLFISLYN